MRICEANMRTSRCPLHRARENSGRPIQQSFPHRLRESEEIDRSRCGFAEQIRGRPVARSTERGRTRDGQFNKVFPIVSVNPRRSTAAGADLRSKYADVPLPAPWSKEDFGNGRFSPLCSRTSPDLGMPLKPVRICEANARTSPCSLQFQNVRLMPAAHTCTCARYNGWVTTNVPITKKEPL